MSGQFEIYDHPSAWKASDFNGKKSVSEKLQPDHIAAFDAALQSVRERKIDLEEITREDFPLSSIQDSVDRWVFEIQGGRGLLVLTDFPVEKYNKEECAIMYFGLGCHFGKAQSQSLMGDKLGHVVNVGGKDTRERAYRNSVELALHTDASDIVAMMCLVKAMQGGMSGYCSGPAVYNHFIEHYPDLLKTLRDGFQYHLFGEQKPGKSPVTLHKIPVFSESEGYLSVSYLRSYIELAFDELGRERTDLEQRALDTFDKVAHSPDFRLDYMMEPGDICFFNNYTVLHTRSEFFDHEEPALKRHLLRLWLRAWQPRPLAQNISTYRSRQGIESQKGRGTYYQGEVTYKEASPPQVKS